MDERINDLQKLINDKATKQLQKDLFDLHRILINSDFIKGINVGIKVQEYQNGMPVDTYITVSLQDIFNHYIIRKEILDKHLPIYIENASKEFIRKVWLSDENETIKSI